MRESPRKIRNPAAVVNFLSRGSLPQSESQYADNTNSVPLKLIFSMDVPFKYRHLSIFWTAVQSTKFGLAMCAQTLTLDVASAISDLVENLQAY